MDQVKEKLVLRHMKLMRGINQRSKNSTDKTLSYIQYFRQTRDEEEGNVYYFRRDNLAVGPY